MYENYKQLRIICHVKVITKIVFDFIITQKLRRERL